MNNDKNKIKEYYGSFKEAWDNPRKKAGIKLGGYFIFFFILLLFAAITSRTNTYNNANNQTTNTTTTVAIDKYIDKQNDLLMNKHDINYVININNIEYKINGSIENKVLNGYLETPEGIKKIILKDNILYEIKNNEEILLEIEINKDYINVEYIINLIKQSSAIIDDSNGEKIYTYDLSGVNTNIVVKTNETSIIEMNISNNQNQYFLYFDK